MTLPKCVRQIVGELVGKFLRHAVGPDHTNRHRAAHAGSVLVAIEIRRARSRSRSWASATAPAYPALGAHEPSSVLRSVAALRAGTQRAARRHPDASKMRSP